MSLEGPVLEIPERPNKAIARGRWERVLTVGGPDLLRMRVPGGWLLCLDSMKGHWDGEDRVLMLSGHAEQQRTLVFVADPGWEWTGSDMSSRSGAHIPVVE